MKLFDFVRGWANDASYDIEEKSICMTLDELEEMWRMGMEHGHECGQYGSSGSWPNLQEYLKEKGIQLPQKS